MVEMRSRSGLDALISRAQRRLAWPRLVRAFGPLALVLGAFLIASWSGAIGALSPVWKAVALLVLVLGSLIALVRGLRLWRSPTREEAARALDRSSEMRPLASLSDRPASEAEGSRALWQAHRERLLEAVRKLRLPSTAQDWRRVDPLSLRYVLPALVLLSGFFAGRDALPRLQAAVSPDLGALFGADQLVVTAWVTPPDHTGQPPVYLSEERRDISVPAGSKLTVRVIAPGRPQVRLRPMEGRRALTLPVTRQDDGAWESLHTLAADGVLEIAFWGPRQSWTFKVTPDTPPTARFVEDPKLTPNDRVGFTWIASDDFGVETLWLELVWAAEGDRPEQTDRVAITMNAVSPTSADEATELDLTRHKWAGLDVKVRLVAIDALGQEGASDPRDLKVPEKLLLQPLARAAQEVRLTVLRETGQYPAAEPNLDALREGALNLEPVTRLERAPPGIRHAELLLEALTFQPEALYKDITVYLAFVHARNLLRVAADMPEALAVEGILWAAALRAEYGSAADALAAFMAARQALEKALRDGASEEEIARLVEAFKEAAKNYVAAKIAESMRNPEMASPDGMDGEDAMAGGPNLGASNLEDMLNALGELSETGARDQARQLLSDISRMLEDLEFQRGGAGSESADAFPIPGQEGEPGDSDRTPESEQAMRDMLERLSRLLGDQRQLNDDTLRSGQRDPFARPDPSQSGQGGDGDQLDPEALAERQRELGERLGELAERLAELEEGGTQGSEGEGDAAETFDPRVAEAIRRAQRRAEAALERGDLRLAERFQQEAVEGLRELSDQAAEGLDRMRGEQTEPEGDTSAQTDPFGNPIGVSDDGSGVKIPDKSERQKAKDILDEIRRRFSDTKDEDEKDYLERLLDRF